MKSLSIVLLLMTSPAFGQSVKLPSEVRGGVGAWVIIAPEKIDGGEPRFRIDPGLQEVRLDLLLPPELISKLKGRVVTASKPGIYKIESWNAKGDVASEISTCLVTIGDPAPLPPDPKPEPKPEPKPPIPSSGLRAMVIYEATTGSAPLTARQINELWGDEMASYVKSKFAKDSSGTPEFRRFDKDIPLSSLDKVWVDAMAAWKSAGSPCPGLVVSNGVTGYAGPLPEKDILGTIKKYER